MKRDLCFSFKKTSTLAMNLPQQAPLWQDPFSSSGFAKINADLRLHLDEEIEEISDDDDAFEPVSAAKSTRNRR